MGVSVSVQVWGYVQEWVYVGGAWGVHGVWGGCCWRERDIEPNSNKNRLNLRFNQIYVSSYFRLHKIDQRTLAVWGMAGPSGGGIRKLDLTPILSRGKDATTTKPLPWAKTSIFFCQNSIDSEGFICCQYVHRLDQLWTTHR